MLRTVAASDFSLTMSFRPFFHPLLYLGYLAGRRELHQQVKKFLGVKPGVPLSRLKPAVSLAQKGSEYMPSVGPVLANKHRFLDSDIGGSHRSLSEGVHP